MTLEKNAPADPADRQARENTHPEVQAEISRGGDAEAITIRAGEAVAFLRAVAPKGNWLLAAITPDGGITPALFGANEEARLRKWLEANARRNIYYQANHVPEPRDEHGKAIRAKLTDVREVRFLQCDCDLRACEKFTPESIAKERALIRERLLDPSKRPAGVPAPTFVIDSGGGFQALWRLKTPTSLDGSEQAARDFGLYNLWLANMLEGDTSVQDVSHLLRLPGTINWPTRKKVAAGRVVAPTMLEDDTGAEYPLTMFRRAEVASGAAGRKAAGASGHAVPAAAEPAEFIGSVNVLDQWGVPDRYKAIINQGDERDADNSPSNFPSRSEAVFAVACELVRRGVPDDIILAILLDPNLGISESVLDKGRNAQNYAVRQLERALEENPRPGPILAARLPMLTAEAFVAHERPTLKYHAKDYLEHDGAAYRAVDDDTARGWAWRFLHRCRVRTEQDGPEPFAPLVNHVTGLLDALLGIVNLPEGEISPPCWLDGREGPPPGEIVACRNGLLHLPTGELLPPTSEFFTRNALAFDYEPDAPAPERWLKFLAEVWPDDAEGVAVLQEVFGYMLTPNTSQQKIFLLIGPTRSGKGTIGRVLEALVGKRNVCAPSLNSLSSAFGLEPLLGKQLALVSDMRLGAKSDPAAIAENLLRISGEDAVSVNRKHKGAVECQLATRFFVMTNELPHFNDASGALANRFVVLQMRQSFLGREDPGLTAALTAERPGILAWAIAGWHRLRGRGYFVEPASSREEKEHLIDMASPVRAFVRDRCERGAELSVSKDDLYLAYRAWAAGFGGPPPWSKDVFARKLFAAFSDIRTAKPRAEGERRLPSFTGIGLRAPPDPF